MIVWVSPEVFVIPAPARVSEDWSATMLLPLVGAVSVLCAPVIRIVKAPAPGLKLIACAKIGVSLMVAVPPAVPLKFAISEFHGVLAAPAGVFDHCVTKLFHVPLPETPASVAVPTQ